MGINDLQAANSSGSEHNSSEFDEDSYLIDGLMKSSDDEDEPKGPKVGLSMSLLNILSAVLGVAIVGLPYGVLLGGIAAMPILVLIVVLMISFTLKILVESSNSKRISNYQDLAGDTFGRSGYVILSITQLSISALAVINHNITISDNMVKLFYVFSIATGEDFSLSRPLLLCLTTLFVTFPLSWYRDIGHIAKYGVLNILCVIAMLTVMVISFPHFWNKVPSSNNDWILIKPSFVHTCSILAHAVVCHHVALPIYNSMHKRSEKKWKILVNTTMFISTIIYLIIGLVGYLTFKTFTEGNILENYCTEHFTAVMARITMTLILLLTLQCELFVCREVANTFIFNDIIQNSLPRHICFSFVLLAILFGCSNITDCLGVVLSINGCIAAIPLGFIYPTAIYLKTSKESKCSKKGIAAIFVLICGILMSASGLVYIIVSTIQEGVECSHSIYPFYCD